jgi:hypothetical protein
MDTYSNDKLQYFVTSEGNKLIVHSIKNIPFIVVTKDPDYRIIAYCKTEKIANERLAYFNKIWASSEYPVMIIKRDNSVFIKNMSEEDYNNIPDNILLHSI